MMIPKPFSRGVFVVGEMMPPQPKDELEPRRLELELAMDEVTARADSLADPGTSMRRRSGAMTAVAAGATRSAAGAPPPCAVEARKTGPASPKGGRLDARSDLPDNPVWIHAVSVGESVAAMALAASMRARDDAMPILMTTNTVTSAARVAAQAADTGLTHLYQPLDHPDMVASFLRRVRPRLALFLESDFWPNLVIRTAASGIPVAFVSAQLSDRAFSRWQKQSGLASALFGTASLILAVDDRQAERFITLGADRQRVRVGGSLKLPGQARPTRPDLVSMLKDRGRVTKGASRRLDA